MSNEWILNQANSILFVMVDAANNEVAGIGDGNLTIELSKNGGVFGAGAGINTEVSDGWYKYAGTAGDANTLGPIAIKVTGAGAVQQNLEYVVKQRNASAIEFTYTVLDNLAAPIEGVEVWISTDIAGLNVIWNGDTNAFGIALDDNGYKPFLDAGTYYFWSQKTGYVFVNPDSEVVS